MAIRLQKYLAECGIASRRASEALIAEGRVTVNGDVATLGQSVEPGSDQVCVDGEAVDQDRKLYVVLNKPRGHVTTAKDTHGRPTVVECLEGVPARVFPIGRLDMDVDGVLLLTNDGELSHSLMHPSFEVPKTYSAWVRGQMTDETAARLAAGVKLEDGPTAPAKIEIMKRDTRATLIRLTLHEGRKREVKRMCLAVGHPVRSLRRIAFADIRVNGLRPGEWRYMTESEVAHLRQITAK